MALTADDFRNNLMILLDETFEHPARAEGSAYLDRGVAWRQTLEELTAEQASEPVVLGGTSVVGQVSHACYYLESLEKFIHGGKPKLDWPGSWSPSQATADEWEELKKRFFATYERLREHWRTAEDWDEDSIGEALVVVIHSAYHLGAVRQIARVVVAG